MKDEVFICLKTNQSDVLIRFVLSCFVFCFHHQRKITSWKLNHLNFTMKIISDLIEWKLKKMSKSSTIIPASDKQAATINNC
jgi:hypothetical protein